MMNQAALLLNELFKTTVEGYNKRVTPDLYSIDFSVEGQNYTLEAMCVDEATGEWSVSFSLAFYDERKKKLLHSYQLTGTGHVFKVFGVVMHLVEDFVEEVHPSILRFSASADEPSRVKLYDRLANMIAQTRQYRLETTRNRYGKSYMLSLDAGT